MVKVTFVSSDGTRRAVDIAEGETAREAALFNVPGIDGDCGRVCACATCHVFVDPAWIDKVGRLAEGSAEADLLRFAEGANEYGSPRLPDSHRALGGRSDSACSRAAILTCLRDACFTRRSASEIASRAQPGGTRYLSEVPASNGGSVLT